MRVKNMLIAILGVLVMSLYCPADPAGTDDVALAYQKVLSAKRSAVAPLLSCPPVLDGSIDSVFNTNGWETTMFLKNTAVMTFPKEQTTVFLGHDSNTLFFAFRCMEPNVNKIKAVKGLPKASEVYNNDNVEVLIKPAEKKEVLHLMADVHGQIWAARETRGEFKDQYEIKELTNHAIKAQGQICENSWVVEIAVPLALLNAPLEGEWGLNLCRLDIENYEVSSWNHAIAFQNPASFGRLVFAHPEEYLVKEQAFRKALDQLQADRDMFVRKAAQSQSVYEFAYGYKFGPAEISSPTGYKPVAPGLSYSKERGYGWLETQGISAVAFNEKDCGGGIYRLCPGKLLNSFATATNSADSQYIEHVFRVDCPNGEYKVHLLMGDIKTRPNELLNALRKFDVLMNDGLTLPVELSRYNVATPFFRVKVDNGKLEFKFRAPKTIAPKPILKDLIPDPMAPDVVMGRYLPGWILNSIVIYPAGDRKKAERQIARDEMEYRLLPPEKLVLAEKIESPKEEPLQDILAAEKEMGFITFARPLGDIIYSSSVPQRDEITNAVSIQAAPGETTQVSFGVYPLRDIDQFAVQLEDLKLENNIIPAGQMQIGVVRTVPFGSPASYRLMPWIIEPVSVVDMDMNEKETKWLWLTIRVPSDTRPGNYRGKATLKAPRAGIGEIDLQVEVLPFRLAELKGKYGGAYGMYPSMLHFDLFLKDLADHGMKTTCMVAFPDTMEKTVKMLELMKSFGVDGPIPLHFANVGDEEIKTRKSDGPTVLSEEQKKKIVDTLRRLQTVVQAKKLPEVIFTAFDEAGCFGEIYLNAAVDAFRSVKAALPGLRVYTATSPDYYKHFEDAADIICFIDTRDFRKYRLSLAEKARGKSIWTYPNKYMLCNPDINAARYQYSWMMWAAGVDGVIPFAYTATMHPYNQLQAEPWYVAVPSTVGGFQYYPNLAWEMARVGLYDLRYITTLEDAIQKARQSGKAKAVKAAAEQEIMLAKIDRSVEGSYMYYEDRGYWKSAVFESLRQKLIQGILAIQKAMKE